MKVNEKRGREWLIFKKMCWTNKCPLTYFLHSETEIVNSFGVLCISGVKRFDI